MSGGLHDPIPVAPFIAWLDTRITANGAEENPLTHALADIGWSDDASVRRLYRWRHEVQLAERRDVEDALHRAGVGFWEVYPDPDDDRTADDEDYCWACRAFVATIDEACAWCDAPIVHVDLSTLPPRGRPELRAAPEPEPSIVVRHRPRVRKGRPFYLDVMLDRRRAALETFAATASIQQAAELAAPGIFSSVESAANAVRALLVREDWYRPSGQRGCHTAPERRQAAQRVRRALDDGTWDHVAPDIPSPSQRRIFDEGVVRDAAWLYLYDEVSFGQIAQRLLARTTAGGIIQLKTALIDEWNRRGWPRRTHRAAHVSYQQPKGRQRCTGTRVDGARCQRWAQNGKRVCFDHDPARVEEQRARNIVAAAARHADAAPLEPWRWWLRRRAIPVAGSVAAVHRRVGDVVSYDTLAEWAKLRPRGGAPKVRSVRRSTIDRVLAAWGDGTTFEDIYLPVTSDDADLVPAGVAA